MRRILVAGRSGDQGDGVTELQLRTLDGFVLRAPEQDQRAFPERCIENSTLTPVFSGSNRIVVGAEMKKERGMYMLAYDAGSGALSIDASINPGSERPGYIDLDHQVWPYGPSGPARAHSALFLPSAGR